MTDAWKRRLNAIFSAVLTVIVGILTLGIYFLVRRKPAEADSSVAAQAEAQIAATRAEIHADSDQALADRFNALAKKEEKP